ncbi:hypothetical protein [Parerythrobacter lacustris]|uniref:Uncharacterized protein n=1 Tax=Parerythrobacter lacustris TaxID=2969984 RepID=A0ABT1XP87_9SPHN|nr:hypothetical protein [Parerythrobacter lacustris]MCR2833481.1 hypothetical protein [Parerythrobacter lacustris]
MYGDALTTKERIKDRLQITATSFDTVLDRLILSVTARIEQMCGRRFIQGTYTHELHDGSDSYGTRRTFLIVKNAPVQTVSALQYNAGSNSSPNWLAVNEDYYHTDRDAGIIYVPGGLPRGFQNVRVTYTGGFSGYSIGVNNFWFFNITPTGTVDGSNLTFTLPEDATQVIVYADGMREAASNVTFVPGSASFTLAAGRAPTSTIAADYLRENAAEDSDLYLPADLTEMCEEAVVRIFKRRDSEGRLSETFQESSITWSRSIFTDEDLRTIRNYRRGYNL